jgi:hypothetical protein
MTTVPGKAILAAAFACPLVAHAGGLYLYEIGTSDCGFAGAGTAARAEDCQLQISVLMTMGSDQAGRLAVKKLQPQ